MHSQLERPTKDHHVLSRRTRRPQRGDEVPSERHQTSSALHNDVINSSQSVEDPEYILRLRRFLQARAIVFATWSILPTPTQQLPEQHRIKALGTFRPASQRTITQFASVAYL